MTGGKEGMSGDAICWQSLDRAVHGGPDPIRLALDGVGIAGVSRLDDVWRGEGR